MSYKTCSLKHTFELYYVLESFLIKIIVSNSDGKELKQKRVKQVRLQEGLEHSKEEGFKLSAKPLRHHYT